MQNFIELVLLGIVLAMVLESVNSTSNSWLEMLWFYLRLYPRIIILWAVRYKEEEHDTFPTCL